MTLGSLGATSMRTERPGGHGISEGDLEGAQEWLAARTA
jgi:predicted esterase